jgi:hypothetical protein
LVGLDKATMWIRSLDAEDDLNDLMQFLVSKNDDNLWC